MSTLWDRAAATHTVMPGLRPNGRVLSIQERFEEWAATDDGQKVIARIEADALRLRADGWQHFGIRTLWEVARHDHNLRVGPNAGRKLNDSFTSRVARLLMKRHTELASFFEVRELRA